ncbi:nucleotidyltransferase domain-containing protein [Bacillus sp. PK3_68]|uniref:type VII toxin-antitoxin system MntA family adenylyltransferase antitoxin n=1 Tax=Bacillus sp. PK3_68 TaxID=2027408 RepID=UPI001C7CDC29|nr:nucleotidyltransferase domain-containing protein [Bacillus sp. PK3_68]
MLDKNMESMIVETLNEDVSPVLIYLFGSTAKGITHQDSDIDVAFLSSEEKIDQYELFLLAQKLAAKLNRDVDLIDLGQASTVFKAQIVSTGKAIYCADEQKKAYWELHTLKMYAKLNEERSPILKNIGESGSVYEK